MMAVESGKEQPIVTTQRAYTLRLNGADKDDNSWRERLWNTHAAVNKGAKAFGDWLLTMRGGLCHTLADSDIHGKGNRPGRKLTQREINNRRIVLTLSWLSVESEHGAPKDYYVPNDLDTNTGERANWKTIEALREILKCRGVSNQDVENWLAACKDSITATIREDAVWVNRSKAFDNEQVELGKTLDRDACKNLLLREMFQDYFVLDILYENEDDEDTVTNDTNSDQDSKLQHWARGWLSTNWGSGPKSDKSQIASSLETLCSLNTDTLCGLNGTDIISAFLKVLPAANGGSSSTDPFVRLCQQIGWKTGRKSSGYMALKKLYTGQTVTKAVIDEALIKFSKEAENKKGSNSTASEWTSRLRNDIEGAIGMPFVVERNLTGEFSAILGSAAGRVSMAHSWIKRAEEQRSKFEIERAKLKDVPVDACKWLDDFCEQRGSDSGAKDFYRIRRGAVDGWKQIVAAWAALLANEEDADSDLTSGAEALRIQVARELQDTVEKFGDIQLFEALARAEAKCVWENNGKADAQWLLDYVAGTDAIAKKRRFKVPAYRHPDALLHPIFCEFGDSRWSIEYAIHRAPARLA